ncbi:hypothetical protein [Halobacteriovorax sp. CON-3]|uniref:hypothetical protein n=1 Tax=Halobacteriovorax sp. CON-3 TaxID=3157710 RepID=UPI00372062C6
MGQQSKYQKSKKLISREKQKSYAIDGENVYIKVSTYPRVRSGNAIEIESTYLVPVRKKKKKDLKSILKEVINE